MKAIKIIQLCAGLSAIAAMVLLEIQGVKLSDGVIAMLAFVAGWTQRRPSEMLPAPK